MTEPSRGSLRHAPRRGRRRARDADSGNTGFSSGPHLHFAVWRNAGGTQVSVPITFAGIGAVPVTPTTATPLTAY